ncbi:MAG TPA: potassium channel family protein [Methylocystis sp.]|nr:potassium channel family protein [Methylocystis sp.]
MIMMVRRRLSIWRGVYGDRLLTILTVLLALMMFVVAPLQVADGNAFTGFGGVLALIVLGGVLVLSGSFIASMLVLVALLTNLYVIISRLQGTRSDFHLHLISAAWLTISLTLGFVVARAVFAAGRVTYHRILGAVLLYLLVVLAFVPLYVTVGLMVPDAFAHLAVEDNPGLTSALIYFSCVTLTTVGYGDITPVHPFARSLCNIESIIGQLFPAILIARLVTLQLSDAHSTAPRKISAAPRLHE